VNPTMRIDCRLGLNAIIRSSQQMNGGRSCQCDRRDG
jgi:hypothetical protein